jgi:endonuclease/exonuclease/phosphatase family metal-dependent hydrolase
VRIATFNVLHGRSLTDGAVDLDRFAKAVAGLEADVLGLQEVDRDQPRSHGADLAGVAAAEMGYNGTGIVRALGPGGKIDYLRGPR